MQLNHLLPLILPSFAWAPPSPRWEKENKLTKVGHALSGTHDMPDKGQFPELVRHVHAVAHHKFVRA